jgi:hypothetical protein
MSLLEFAPVTGAFGHVTRADIRGLRDQTRLLCENYYTPPHL